MPKTEPFDKFSREYEAWFERNRFVYLSELEAVRKQLPETGRRLEIGVGTGRFAAPLGIELGLEPSRAMSEAARRRGVTVIEGTGEELPFDDAEFDAVLMVTTICFLDDVMGALAEAYRVLKSGGCLIVGFVDKNSLLGRTYQQQRAESLFYGPATFFSSDEVSRFMEGAGLRELTFVQTVFQDLPKIVQVEPVRAGHGEGSFVVARGVK